MVWRAVAPLIWRGEHSQRVLALPVNAARRIARHPDRRTMQQRVPEGRMTLSEAPRVRIDHQLLIGGEWLVIGAPYGGYKASGIGSEESLHELLSLTQTKNVAVFA